LTQVRCLDDPTVAVEVFDQFQPDLVLIDLHMPVVDGFEVLASLRERLGDVDYVPLIVLTADSTAASRDRALAAGADDFLIKPFDRTEVILRVGNLLRTRSLHTRLRQDNRELARRLRQQDERRDWLADEQRTRQARIERLLTDDTLTMVFQPIVNLATGEMVGMESLARFDTEPRRGPDVWFAEAAAVGLGAQLELAAIRAAVRELPHLPDGTYLSVNVSPPVAQSLLLPDTLPVGVAERLVLEITEHTSVGDYPSLVGALAPLRASGIRLAVDDAGAGYASLRHILRLEPEIIKLDIDLTRDVDSDPVRRALAQALVTFAADIGATVVAEGIETEAELRTLRDIGVTCGQGYHLGRPAPLAAALLAQQPASRV
jgi:EAL domain-containing protein (putative c-di-GMP-specific phosphodiesterase class I)